MSAPVLPAWAMTAGRAFRWVLTVALAVLVIGLLWIGIRGALAYGHLQETRATARTAIDQLRDPAQLGDTLDQLAVHTAAARDLTGDPVWRAAEAAPWAGPQLAAVRTVAAQLDAVVTGAGDPLAAAAGGLSLDALRPVDGRIDTAVFAALAEPARRSADATAAAAAAVDAVDRTPLLGVVADAVDEAAGLLAQTRTATDALARASAVLPGMLGADGPRTHLVLIQNNAEWRTQGGIVGATSVIRADDGGITLVGHRPANSYIQYPDAIVDLGEYGPIYAQNPGRFMQNASQVPAFPLTAAIAREFAAREGTAVDGVISLDPVALSYLLSATGPVTLPTGDVLTADNAVARLLNEVYFRYPDPAMQDEFFGAAAASVFGALTTGAADPAGLVGALARAGEERRLYVWSAVEAEQQVLDDTTLAGHLADSDTGVARFVVGLNEGGGSKASWYVHPEVRLDWGSCATGTQLARELTLDLSLSSTLPADAATTFPWYVTGAGNSGVPPGTVRTLGEIYLPEGYALVRAERDPQAGFGSGAVAERRVLTFSADLLPGETARVSVTARATTAAPTAEAWVTPTADPAVPTVVRAVCDPRERARTDLPASRTLLGVPGRPGPEEAF